MISAPALAKIMVIEAGAALLVTPRVTKVPPQVPVAADTVALCFAIYFEGRSAERLISSLTDLEISSGFSFAAARFSRLIAS